MKPTIVSNTGPLIALGKAGLLSLLDNLFEHVIIPEAVRQEIDAGSEAKLRFSDVSSICKKLLILPDPEDDLVLSRLLDRGEAAVIRLAKKIAPDLTLLDERKGRKIAADIFGLKVLGTAGLLVRAKREGLITEVRTALDRMTAGGYYIHESIRDHILRLAEEE